MGRFSRTAKEFKRQGESRIRQINSSLKSNENEDDWINGNEIQWNELYLAFCDVIGNENPKMNLWLEMKSIIELFVEMNDEIYVLAGNETANGNERVRGNEHAQSI